MSSPVRRPDPLTPHDGAVNFAENLHGPGADGRGAPVPTRFTSFLIEPGFISAGCNVGLRKRPPLPPAALRHRLPVTPAPCFAAAWLSQHSYFLYGSASSELANAGRTQGFRSFWLGPPSRPRCDVANRKEAGFSAKSECKRIMFRKWPEGGTRSFSRLISSDPNESAASPWKPWEGPAIASATPRDPSRKPCRTKLQPGGLPVPAEIVAFQPPPALTGCTGGCPIQFRY